MLFFGASSKMLLKLQKNKQECHLKFSLRPGRFDSVQLAEVPLMKVTEKGENQNLL